MTHRMMTLCCLLLSALAKAQAADSPLRDIQGPKLELRLLDVDGQLNALEEREASARRFKAVGIGSFAVATGAGIGLLLQALEAGTASLFSGRPAGSTNYTPLAVTAVSSLVAGVILTGVGVSTATAVSDDREQLEAERRQAWSMLLDEHRRLLQERAAPQVVPMVEADPGAPQLATAEQPMRAPLRAPALGH